jgi:hypothetical protein
MLYLTQEQKNNFETFFEALPLRKAWGDISDRPGDPSAWATCQRELIICGDDTLALYIDADAIKPRELFGFSLGPKARWAMGRAVYRETECAVEYHQISENAFNGDY